MRKIAVREKMRETVQNIRGKIQRFADLARRAASAISDDVRGHGRAVFAVTPINFLDDAFAPIAARQIEIDVRPAFAAFAEETFEDEMIAHRIDRRDPEAKTDRAVRRAAAALHHDVVFAAEIDDVPDDQKITGEAELLDERQLFIQLRRHGRADRGVALLRAEERDGAQKRIHRVALRHREIGKFVAEIFERKLEALREAHRCLRSRPVDRGRALAFLRRSSNAVPRYCVRRVARGIKMGVFADAGKNIEHFAAGRGGMLHAVGREQRKPMMLRQLDQLAVDPFFAPDEMSLHLDINVIASKSFE